MNSKEQILDYENKIDVVLSNGKTVSMFGKEKQLGSTKMSNEYYYIPVGLRLSKNPLTDAPAFLFLKYTTDDDASIAGLQGALIHFLIEWGLTPEEEQEAQKKLEEKTVGLHLTGKAILNGAVSLATDIEESYRIISAVLTDKTFTPNFVTTGRAPLVPGDKVAVAARLEKYGAQLLAATFDKGKSISDVSFNLRFGYTVIMPAVEGSITIDWEKVDSLVTTFSRNYTHIDRYDNNAITKSNAQQDDIITDSQKEKILQLVRNTNAVTINLAVTYNDPNNPTVQKVVNAFMDYFLQSISEKEFTKPGENIPKDKDGDGKEDNYDPQKDLYVYRIDKAKLQVKKKRKKHFT